MPDKRFLIRLTPYLIALLAIVMISFSEKQQGEKTCKGINIIIDNQYDQYFIDEQDVQHIITANGDRRIVGESFDLIGLRNVERQLIDHEFVRNAEVFKDLKGYLNVKVYQTRPVARLISQQLKDRYINQEGDVIPVSQKFTARVMLISGAWANDKDLKSLYDNEYGRKLKLLIDHITADNFWKAQVAQLDIDKNGNIEMMTQVSKQLVDFGQPEQIEKKFMKLMIFYKEILPANGWNSYEQVSVKFKDQIVCE